MFRFWNVLTEPMLDARGFSRLVEIGSEAGGNTEALLRLAAKKGAHVDIIDPFPPKNMDAIRALLSDHGAFHEGLSLEMLPKLPAADVYLIDGDHNYYTVAGELRIIQETIDAAGAPAPLLLFHDVGWPYGRRDMYYNPSNVPEEGRRPHKKGGIYPGQAGVFPKRGANAIYQHAEEGGPKNGVLTAIEDFQAAQGDTYRWFDVPVLHGYGALVPTQDVETDWAKILRELAEPGPRVRALYQLVEEYSVDLWMRLQMKG